MERRAFIEKMISVIALGSIFLVSGCQKEEKIPRPGNQDKLWQMATGQLKAEEPLELALRQGHPGPFSRRLDGQGRSFVQAPDGRWVKLIQIRRGRIKAIFTTETQRTQRKQIGMLEYQNRWNIGIMECWV